MLPNQEAGSQDETLPRPLPAIRTSVIIPTYQPGIAAVQEMEEALRRQSLPPSEVIVIDSSSTDGSFRAWSHNVILKRIAKNEFNHGRTRNLGATLASGDALVFMTQDAVPADEQWLEALIRPLSTEQARAAYSRQLPRSDATPTETFARLANYPAVPALKCPGDSQTAVQRNFFSNVSSAVDSRVFRDIGGFPKDVILNEDMVLAANLLDAGHCIAYAAESRVVHSHAYTVAQQFRRYFDIGVALKRGGPTLADSGTQRAGIDFVFQLLRYLVDEREFLSIPVAIAESAAKWTGYRLGHLEAHIPLSIKRSLSMHKSFWR